MIAAKYGDAKSVSALLSHPNIDVNAALDGGSTALIIAAQKGYAEIVSALLSRKDVDWGKVGDQLSHPALRSDNEALLLLAATIPNEKLRNSIIASFNEKNPDDKINQEGNDILGAGPEMYKKIKDLKSCYKRYLTSTFSSLDENAAESLANLRFFDLFNNHQNKRQEALARDSLVTGLVSKLGSLDIASGLVDEEALVSSRELNQEDLYKLTSKIIDSEDVMYKRNRAQTEAFEDNLQDLQSKIQGFQDKFNSI
jgi:ankyrin repeat protein